MTRRGIATAVGLSIALAVLVSMLPASTRLVTDPQDFRAFYCSGQVVAAHRDPYIAGPIRSCEAREIRAAGMSPFPALAVPAPLPAFDFVPLAAIGMLPFPLASTVFTILLIVAFAGSAILIARISNFPLPATIATLLLSDGIIAILNGQIFPFALLALCASGYAIVKGRYWIASVCACAAAIEPHVALPAIASLAWSLPRTRIPIAITLAVLGILALCAVGIPENVEYVSSVLHAHARSEATAGYQYSLTSLLSYAGIDPDRAVLVGNLQYAAMCVLGVIVARRIARRLHAPELYVLVPPAFALLGGPFIHLTQMAAAVPATLALAHRLPARRNLFGAALLLFAIPWQDLVENTTPKVLGATLLVSAAIAVTFWRPHYRIVTLAITLMLALGLAEKAVRDAFPLTRSDPQRAVAAVAEPARLAEDSWEAFVETTQAGDERRFLFAHAPTWLGILILIGATTFGRRREALRG